MKNKTCSPVTAFLLANIYLAVHGQPNTNVTTDGDMSVEMKTFYSKYLIEYTKPLLIHDQFGQKQNIPKHGGNKIEFRKKHPFPKAMTPLTEGVTPDGRKLKWTNLEATVKQYGDYVTLSDRLITEAVDDNIIYATENCADQAGRTLDTISREVLNGGTNVQYGDAEVAARHLLIGGEASGNHYMTSGAVKRAARGLKTGGAGKISGDYVAIIHPDVSFDLTNDKLWLDVKTYDPSDIYNGEIGKLHGVRFVETMEAKIFHADDLASDSRTLLANGAISSASTTVTFDGGTVAADALRGRYVLIGDNKVKVTANTTTTLTIDTAITASDNAVIYPGEAGAKGRDVYSTLFLGADAYGTTEIDGEGLKHIIKQLGSGGSTDPLDQRATVGWKASKTAERLVEAFMLRVETASTFETGAN